MMSAWPPNFAQAYFIVKPYQPILASAAYEGSLSEPRHLLLFEDLEDEDLKSCKQWTECR